MYCSAKDGHHSSLITRCDLFNGDLAQGTPRELLCFQGSLLPDEMVLFKPSPLLKPRSPWDQLVYNYSILIRVMARFHQLGLVLEIQTFYFFFLVGGEGILGFFRGRF